MNRLSVTLDADARAALEHLRRTGPAYQRERAAAIIKVADGATCTAVAAGGLLRARQPLTVRTWVRDYLRDGVGALAIRGGRGRKPRFSPL